MAGVTLGVVRLVVELIYFLNASRYYFISMGGRLRTFPGVCTNIGGERKR